MISKAKVKAVLSSEAIEFVNKQGHTVLSGPRCKESGLWNINLDDSIVKPKSPVDLALAVRPLPVDSVGDLIEW